MSSTRTLSCLLVAGALCTPFAASAAARPAPIKSPDQAIAALKRTFARVPKRCALDWARIRAEGYEGHWRVWASIRRSAAGRGMAVWRIGTGYPVAVNPLARHIAHGCR